MNINVDPNKLKSFAAYVSDFSKKINTECSEINAATSRLSATIDAEDAAEIREMTREIVRILDSTEPDLQELRERIEGYADLVERLRAISEK